MRETASERKGEATAPAIASERATAFLALVLMPRIIPNHPVHNQARLSAHMDSKFGEGRAPSRPPRGWIVSRRGAESAEVAN